MRKRAPWWVTSSPGPGAQEARCGCEPCSVQPRTLGKDTKALTGPLADWPRHSWPPQAPTQGPRAAAPRGWRPGLEQQSTQPAHPLHRCRGLGTFAWTRRLSTCSSSSLPLSRNIKVTLLMPGWLRRPWAQLPRSQHRPHLLRQKYLLPQWPQLMTPFPEMPGAVAPASPCATVGTEHHQGWERPGDTDHPLPGPQPASFHLPPPLARQEESVCECQRP